MPLGDRHRTTEVRNVDQRQLVQLATQVLEPLPAVARKAMPAVIGRQPRIDVGLRSQPDRGYRGRHHRRFFGTVRGPQHQRQIRNRQCALSTPVALKLDLVTFGPQTRRVLHDRADTADVERGLEEVAGRPWMR
jgi:hypothetical protein